MATAITIVWLYPQQLNLYGDSGNVECLCQRLKWRKISFDLVEFSPKDSLGKIERGDLFFAGGGPDSLQKVVAEDVLRIRDALEKACQSGKPGLFICGFYQLLGRFYRPAEGENIPGLGIFDCFTKHFGNRKKRLVGNIVTGPTIPLAAPSIALAREGLVGFENHEGRTYLGAGAVPFAKVRRGFGNNGRDKTEGTMKNNFVGTYLHGPLLPKNPHLADWLLEKALGEKMAPLDDTLEWEAHKKALRLS